MPAALFRRLSDDFVDAAVNRTELVMPPSIAVEMVKGFTLCMGEGRHERPQRRGH
jgi:hypothetical protein